MRTAKEMYDFCKEKKFGQGMNEKWGLLHFGIIEKNLSADEEVKMCFIGLHNFISMTKHNDNFAYAITNKRILMGQKKLIGENFQTVFLDNVNDITFETGMVFGTITIDTIKEKFNVGMDKIQAGNVNNELHTLIHELKNADKAPAAAPAQPDTATELKKFKELLDTGVITQEDFDKKKAQLLGI